jgi:hypothetical protein
MSEKMGLQEYLSSIYKHEKSSHKHRQRFMVQNQFPLLMNDNHGWPEFTKSPYQNKIEGGIPVA